MIRRLSCFALLLIAIDALGQSYPAKPIRLVVPFPAGESVDATARLARSIASLFNPILYPDLTRHLEITQEEIGALSGISRQNANQCLKRLEKEGLLRLEYGGVTIIDLERLRSYGE